MPGSRLTRWFTESKLSWDYTLIRYNLGLVSLGNFLLAEVWILVISWPVMGPVHRSSKLSLQIRISWRYQCPVHLDWSWGPNIQVFTSSKLPNKLVLCDFYLSITKGQLPQGNLWPWTRWLSAIGRDYEKADSSGLYTDHIPGLCGKFSHDGTCVHLPQLFYHPLVCRQKGLRSGGYSSHCLFLGIICSVFLINKSWTNKTLWKTEDMHKFKLFNSWAKA